MHADLNPGNAHFKSYMNAAEKLAGMGVTPSTAEDVLIAAFESADGKSSVDVYQAGRVITIGVTYADHVFSAEYI